MTVALSSIKKADVGGSPGGNKYRAETLVSASENTLADLFSKINLVDEDFLKYIPDRFLDKEQLKAKANAVEKERKKIARLEKKSAFFSSKTDQAYRQAVESGDLAAL